MLVGCDMVLRVQWLHDLGPILWNSRDFSMQLQYQGRAANLQGLCPSNLIEERNIDQNNKLEKKGLLLQLIEPREENIAEEIHPPI